MSPKKRSVDVQKKEQSDQLVRYVSQLKGEIAVSSNILFIQAPQFLFNTVNLEVIREKGYYAYPPTGLQRLVTSLSGKNLNIKILDLNYLVIEKLIHDKSFDCKNWLDILDENLNKYQPSVIGISCLSVYTDLFNTNHPLTSILSHLRLKNKYILIAGGPTVTNEIKGYLERDLCHFVIEGEGEDRINYLFDLMYEHKSINTLPTQGIHFRHDNILYQSQGQNRVVELHGNLIQSYKNIPIEKYNDVGSLNPYSRMVGQEKPYSVFQLNRGCRFNCKFCGVRSFMGKGVRTHDAYCIVEEIRYLVEERGIRHFEALDDDLIAYPEPLKHILNEFINLRKLYNITWSANNGVMASSISEELLSLMQASGCIGFKVGIESGNQKMLNRMRKPGNIEIFRQKASLINCYQDMFVGGNYIIGLFGDETFGQMLDTFILSQNLQFDWSSFTLFQFTSRPNSISENLKSDGVGATDFIPAKDISSRELPDQRSLPLGPDVFSISKDTIPDRNLIKNIWLTFNLIGNYINNKNLKPSGNPLKFVKWVDAVKVAYPQNPYMCLFAGIGHILLDNHSQAEASFKQCNKIVGLSSNWKYRFNKFGLNNLIEPYPEQRSEIYERINKMLLPYKPFLE